MFDSHTTGKYTTKNESRHQMFPHIEKVLEKPDEVWLHTCNNKKFEVRYIKFHGDKAIVVDTVLGKNNLEVTIWYEMKAKNIRIRSIN